MAEIKMSYIFIEKQKHESKEMQEILLEVIDDAVQERTPDTIIVNDVEIEYRIIQKKNSERCFPQARQALKLREVPFGEHQCASILLGQSSPLSLRYTEFLHLQCLAQERML